VSVGDTPGEYLQLCTLVEARTCTFAGPTSACCPTNAHARGKGGGEGALSVPAVVIAAPASGSGKTTVATGLLGALRRAGHTVAPFKVGPDYIDPGYHTLAARRPGRNLDPVLVGEQLIGPLYRHGTAGADVAVVEGVMGLFDGRIDERAHARGSTAHVAGLLGAPVILVVDARGQSQSIAALLHGFSTFDPTVRVAGVILNQVGSGRHEEVLRQACAYSGVTVLGAIPRHTGLAVPSRHLGLVTAAEHGALAHKAVDAMTELVAAHVDVHAVVAVAASTVTAAAWEPSVDSTPTPVTVAMAGGKAFTFGYAEHTELLAAAGAEVVVFDPLTDPLPADTDALVLPGGFPEQFTAELAANDVARQQVRKLAGGGAPVHAECAGLTYLVDELDGHPMCGVLSGSARFTDHLTLGYRDAVAVADSSVHAGGERATGHEFHRTTVEFNDSYPPAWVYRGHTTTVRDGAVHKGVHASYLHTHPAASPEAAARFVAHAAALGSRR
jgi:cobyrinic acid a,c-diamide synthase